MKRILLTVAFTGTCFFSIIAQTTGEIATNYVALYTAMQFDEIGVYYNELSIFEDPTTSFFDKSGRYESKQGKEKIVAYLKEGFNKISNIDFQIEKQYTSGVISYSYGILKYDYTIVNQEKIKILKMELPLAIILKIKDGKVLHHQDIADYSEWYTQYSKQIK